MRKEFKASSMFTKVNHRCFELLLLFGFYILPKQTRLNVEVLESAEKYR